MKSVYHIQVMLVNQQVTMSRWVHESKSKWTKGPRLRDLSSLRLCIRTRDNLQTSGASKIRWPTKPISAKLKKNYPARTLEMQIWRNCSPNSRIFRPRLPTAKTQPQLMRIAVVCREMARRPRGRVASARRGSRPWMGPSRGKLKFKRMPVHLIAGKASLSSTRNPSSKESLE